MNLQDIIISILSIVAGYLSGSVNYAVPVTRMVIGKDIRTLGNYNPGTSNVIREVGVFWGVLVGVLDGLKGLLPVLLLRIVFFRGDAGLNFFILYLVGAAAVLGHCKSIFMKFKGGGGIGTMLGVSLFFVPIEFLFSMVISGLIVLIFFKNSKFRFGQKAPVFFVTLTPFMTLLSSLLMDIHLFAHISIGGHNWGTIAGSFVMSLGLLSLNLKFLTSKTGRREV